MTQKIPFEPFTVWKDLYDQTEKAWHDIIQTTLASETFSEGLGQIQNSYLQYHDHVSELAKDYMKQANIASPEEIAKVATLVINLEEKIDSIDDQLYETIQTSTTQHQQLQQSITALENKFDAILDGLSSLDKKLTALKTTPEKPPAATKRTAAPKKKPTPRKTAPKTTPKATTDQPIEN